MVQPVYEPIVLCGGKETVSDRKKVENKSELLVEGNKLLFKSAEVFYKNAETENDKIKYSGRVVFYATYLNSDGEIRKYENSVDFEGALDYKDAGEKTLLGVRFELYRLETDENNGSYNFTATIDVTAELKKCIKIEALVGGDDLICDKKENEFMKSFGIKKVTYPVQQEFELSYPVKEVLCQKASPVITNVQCGMNSVIIDGEIYLHSLFLQNDEKGGIISEENVVPYRAELDWDGVDPSMTASANVVLKGIKSDVSVDTESKRSIQDATITLVFIAEVFSEEKVPVACDAFSINKEIGMVKDECAYFNPEFTRTASATVSVKCGADTTGGATFIAANGEKAEITTVTDKGDKLLIEGVLSMNGYFADGENKIFSRRLEAPFEAETAIICGGETATNAAIKNFNVRVISDEETEVTGELVFTLKKSEKREIKYIKAVTETGDKIPCDAAISVYIPVCGEDLWSLSKRLGVAPETVSETNKDLSFPLSGKERIVVYRRK